MSMSIYNEMQSVASELLSDAEFNQGGVNKIEYVRVVPGSGPPDDPGPTQYVKTPLDGVARGVSFKYVSDGLALSSDLQVTLAVNPDLILDMKNFIDVDGKRYKIVHDISTPAAGTRVVWKFIIR